MLSLQAVFNKAVRGLLKQGKKSLSRADPTTCAYRGRDGMRCAIGMLIKDKHYTDAMEGGTVHDEAVCDALKKSGVSVDGESFDLCADLQTVHDNRAVKEWRRDFGAVARRFGLSDAVCKKGETA